VAVLSRVGEITGYTTEPLVIAANVPKTTTTITTAKPKVTTEAPAQNYNLGDVNGNGIVDSADATYILVEYAKALVDGKDIKAAAMPAADTNKDGVVNSSDATLILVEYAKALADDRTLRSL
jgi:hypothetical protein